MPAKKAAKKPAKKVSAKTTAKSAPSTNGSRVPRMDAQVDRIVKLRNDGKVWRDIAESVGGTVGQVILAYEKATVKNSEKIKDITAKDIVRLRKEGVSWGRIAVRGGLTEVKVRSMFEESTGHPSLGERIGKGGRHPTGTPKANVVSINARKSATATGKATAKKAAKSAVANAKKSAARRPTKKPAATATTPVAAE